MQYLYKEIQGIDKSGITMSDGCRISFEECEQAWKDMRNAKGSKCVGERDITADRPYFRFYGKGDSIVILFDGKGLFKRRQSQKAFLDLQRQISRWGYSTYDMS